MAEVVCEEYVSSLNDLTFNSKPHISMLTMLAEENAQYAPNIVRVIEAHLQKVRPEAKLPAIYLIDSIVKNIRGEYLSLFTQNLVSTFCSVFEKVDEKTRLQLYKLRQTWMDVFPNKKLYAIDMRVRQMDPAWPISAQASIHVNPKFLKNPSEDEVQRSTQEIQEAEMRKQLIAKQQELLRLQQQKLELELLQTKAKLDEQKRLLQHQNSDGEGVTKQDDVKNVPETTTVITPMIPPTVPMQPNIQLQTPVMPPASIPMPLPHMVMVPKDPRLLRDPRMMRDPKYLHAQNPVMNTTPIPKPTENFMNKPLDIQVKPEPKQNINAIKHNQLNTAGLPAFKPFFPKDRNLRNELPKIPKKKDASASSKAESKQSSKRKTGKDSRKSKSDEGKEKNQKKKSDSVSPKKSPDIKESGKDSTSSGEKRKNSDKKNKNRQESRDVEKNRKANDRKGNRSSSGKKEHDIKKVDNSNRRGSFRDRRNYRSNRDRSESPEVKLDGSGSPGSVDPTSGMGKGEGLLNRLRSSPNRKDGKHHKKIGESKWGDGVGGTQDDVGKENKMELGDVSVTDVDLRVGAESPTRRGKGKRDGEGSESEEPQAKRMRHSSDEDKGGINSLFGSKDQDYRQIPPNEKSQSRCGRSGWAQYKAEHPDEFKKSQHPLRGNRQEFGNLRPCDMDLRSDFEFGGHPDSDSKMGKFAGMGPDRVRGFRGFMRNNDPRLNRGGGFNRGMRQGNRMFDDRNIRRHPMYGRYNSEIENSHPGMNIPNALLLDRRAEILRQADQQLKSGHLTQEQHHELLNQLAKLYELQLLRQKQREEQFCDNFIPNRGFDFPHQRKPGFPGDFEAYQSDSGSSFRNQFNEAAEKEKEEPKPTRPGRRISMLSIFQREGRNSPSTSSSDEESKSGKISAPADNADRYIGIDGKRMKLKYFGCTAVILEGSKAQEILFRGTRREIFVDGNIVLLGFEGDEQTFYINEKPHTMKFGTPTHEIYIDGVPYEARFGGPPIKIMLDDEPHEIQLGSPPPDVELKELSPEVEAEVMKFIGQDNGEKQEAEEAEVEKSEGVVEGVEAEAKDEVDETKVDNSQVEDMEICEDSSKDESMLPVELEVDREKLDGGVIPGLEIHSEPEQVEKTDKGETGKPQNEEEDDIKPEVSKAEEDGKSPEREEEMKIDEDVSSKEGLSKKPDVEQEVAQFTTYHGVQTRNIVDRADYPEFRRGFHKEGDDYPDRGGFESREPEVRDYHNRDKGRDWPDSWRDKNQYRDDRNVQPWNYNICNPMDVLRGGDDYWQRKDEFGSGRRGQFGYGRDRGNHSGSPQRIQDGYGHYRDVQRRDFLPPYGSSNRMDNRMRFDMGRPPMDNRSRFDAWQRFDNIRPRSDGRRPNIRQPHPGQYFQPAPMDMQQPIFPGRMAQEYYSEPDRYPEARPVVEGNIQLNQQPGPAFPFAGPSQPASNNALPSVDIGELYQKLVAAGILAGSTTTAAEPQADDSAKDVATAVNETVAVAVPAASVSSGGAAAEARTEEKVDEQEDYTEKVPTIEFTSESLRTRYEGVIAKLCRGIQCSSCGLRFTSEQTEKYAQHLDWHFRQNRRERDSAKKAMSRKWYYDVQDWVQFEEIEDMEERARSVFEDQAADEQPERLDDVQTIPVAENDEDNMCTVCGESFEQFWDEDKEEWHLRDAMRLENKSYHPMCYEDIRNISMKSAEAEQDMKENIQPATEVEANSISMPDETVSAVVIKQEIEEAQDLDIKQEEPEPMTVDEPVMIKQEPLSPPPAAEISTPFFIEQVKEEPSADPLEPLANALQLVSVEATLPLTLSDSKDIGDIDPSMIVKQEKSANSNTNNPESINKGAYPDPSSSSQSVQLAVSSQALGEEKEEIFREKEGFLKQELGNVDDDNIGHVGEVVPAEVAGSCGVGVVEETTPEDNVAGDEESGTTSSGAGTAASPVPSGPEFIVLPPVMRGTELSGLCSIM